MSTYRHRVGLPKRMTLREFREKYGTNGVSAIITLLSDNCNLPPDLKAKIAEITTDIERLLQEEWLSK